MNRKTANRSEAETDRGRISLAEQAYRALREDVVNDRLPVGRMLTERLLGKRLGLGRTPVHQALLRLHQEGLIQVVPRKGILVLPDSIDRILDLLDARSIIEPILAERAASQASDADLDELQAFAAAPLAAEHEPGWTVDRFIERDRTFHARLAAIAGSPVLADIQKNLHEGAMRFWYSNLARTLDESKAANEHAAVVAAIARRDGPGAAAAMAAHIAEITARLRRLQARTSRADESGLLG